MASPSMEFEASRLSLSLSLTQSRLGSMLPLSSALPAAASRASPDHRKVPLLRRLPCSLPFFLCNETQRSQLEDMAMDASDDTNDSTMIFDSTSSKHHLVSFDDLIIETTITKKANIIEEWIHQVSSKYDENHQEQLIIGLDTEWMKDQNNKTKVAILQLCVKNKCLIIQLSLMDNNNNNNSNIPQSLVSFLRDFNFKFVGVGIENDIKRLKNDYGLECKNGIELSTLAIAQCNNRVFSSRGLKYLAKELVGINMKKSKDICTSKWESEELTIHQIEYACIDAYASYRIGLKLLIENEGIIALNSSD